jgi:hypothetical protein
LNILLIRTKSVYADVVAGIPIGLAILAAIAEAKGHRVRILDTGLDRNPGETLRHAFRPKAMR